MEDIRARADKARRLATMTDPITAERLNTYAAELEERARDLDNEDRNASEPRVKRK